MARKYPHNIMKSLGYHGQVCTKEKINRSWLGCTAHRNRKVSDAVGHNVGAGLEESIRLVGTTENTHNQTAACIHALLYVAHCIAYFSHSARVHNTHALHELVDHVWEGPAVLHFVAGDVPIHLTFKAQLIHQTLLNLHWIARIQTDLDASLPQSLQVGQEIGIDEAHLGAR